MSRDLIELRSEPDLYGILDLSTGVRVENNCQNCNFSQVRIHGLESQYTQILIDGNPVVSSLAKVYGLEHFPAEMVDRIEVVKGGHVQGGERGEGGVAFTSTALDVASTASLVVYGRLRSREDVDVDSDRFSELGRLNSESFGGRVFLDLTGSSNLTFSGHYIHEKRRDGDNIDVPEHLVDIAEATETWRYGGLGGENPSSPDYNSAAGYGLSENPLLNAQGKCNLQMGGQLLSFGVQGSRERLEDRSFSEGSRTLDETYADIGVFMQDDITLGHNNEYEILLGVRVDNHSQVDELIASPRAALKWRVDPAVTLRGGVTTGFNAPQVFDEDLHIEVVGESPRVIVNADGLKGEKSLGYYFSGEYRDVIEGMPVSMVLGGFRTDLENALIVKAGVKNITNKFQEDLDQGAERDPGYDYDPGSPRKITLGLELGFR